MGKAQQEAMEALFAFGNIVRPHLAAELGKVIHDEGLTEREIAVLEFIQTKGSPTFAEIAADRDLERKRGVSSSRLSATLSALFKKYRLVEKRPSMEDSRQPVLTLTPQGKDLLRKLQGVRRAVYEKTCDAMEMTDKQAELCTKLFTRGAENFRKSLADR